MNAMPCTYGYDVVIDASRPKQVLAQGEIRWYYLLPLLYDYLRG